MVEKQRAPRHVKKTTGYKIPPDLERDMNALVESGEFANRSDIITASIRFWFQYRKFDLRTALKDLLQTDEGKEILREAMSSSRSLKKPKKLSE